MYIFSLMRNEWGHYQISSTKVNVTCMGPFLLLFLRPDNISRWYRIHILGKQVTSQTWPLLWILKLNTVIHTCVRWKLSTFSETFIKHKKATVRQRLACFDLTTCKRRDVQMLECTSTGIRIHFLAAYRTTGGSVAVGSYQLQSSYLLISVFLQTQIQDLLFGTEMEYKKAKGLAFICPGHHVC